MVLHVLHMISIWLNFFPTFPMYMWPVCCFLFILYTVNITLHCHTEHRTQKHIDEDIYPITLLFPLSCQTSLQTLFTVKKQTNRRKPETIFSWDKLSTEKSLNEWSIHHHHLFLPLLLSVCSFLLLFFAVFLLIMNVLKEKKDQIRSNEEHFAAVRCDAMRSMSKRSSLILHGWATLIES